MLSCVLLFDYLFDECFVFIFKVFHLSLILNFRFWANNLRLLFISHTFFDCCSYLTIAIAFCLLHFAYCLLFIAYCIPFPTLPPSYFVQRSAHRLRFFIQLILLGC